MELEAYVCNAKGINIMTRNRMLKAFNKNNAGPRLDELINHSPEGHILPMVKERLNYYWSRKFNENSRFKG